MSEKQEGQCLLPASERIQIQVSPWVPSSPNLNLILLGTSFSFPKPFLYVTRACWAWNTQRSVLCMFSGMALLCVHIWPTSHTLIRVESANLCALLTDCFRLMADEALTAAALRLCNRKVVPKASDEPMLKLFLNPLLIHWLFTVSDMFFFFFYPLFKLLTTWVLTLLS